MSNNLDSEKEEKVRSLLRDHSFREIVAETGVAKATITRIRNENFTEEERAQLKSRAQVKGRNKRELRLQEIIKKTEKECEPLESVDLPLKLKKQIFNPKMKFCLKCKKDKIIDDFTINSRMTDGLENQCRECKTAAQRARTVKKTQTNLPEVIPQNVLEPNKLTFGDIARNQLEVLEKEYEELAKHIKAECAEFVKIGCRIAGLDETLNFMRIADEMTTDEGWRQYLEQVSDELCEEEEKNKKKKIGGQDGLNEK